MVSFSVLLPPLLQGANKVNSVQIQVCALWSLAGGSTGKTERIRHSFEVGILSCRYYKKHFIALFPQNYYLGPQMFSLGLDVSQSFSFLNRAWLTCES